MAFGLSMRSALGDRPRIAPVGGGAGRGGDRAVPGAVEGAGVGGEFLVHGGAVGCGQARGLPDQEGGAPFVEPAGFQGGEGAAFR